MVHLVLTGYTEALVSNSKTGDFQKKLSFSLSSLGKKDKCKAINKECWYCFSSEGTCYGEYRNYPL